MLICHGLHNIIIKVPADKSKIDNLHHKLYKRQHMCQKKQQQHVDTHHNKEHLVKDVETCTLCFTYDTCH